MTSLRRPLVATLRFLLGGVVVASRLVSRAQAFVEGLALSGLTDDELQSLTNACYRGWTAGEGSAAFDWERAWFERDLPAAPASLLLGGAGRGRELRYLRDRGYRVVAFDPVPRAESDVHRLTYQQLASGVGREADAGLAAVLDAAPYDAILFGWGSVTHVPGAHVRARLLQAVRRLSDGPLLMSFWTTAAGGPSPLGRSHALGQKLGGLLGDHGSPQRRGDRVIATTGYCHRFTPEEIRGLAADAGYSAACHTDGYAHATLTPVVIE